MIFNFFSSLGKIFLPAIVSINKKKILPPSRAGIGNKFITPKLSDKMAISKNKLAIPCSLVFDTKDSIPTGPDKSEIPTPELGLNKAPSDFNIFLVLLQVWV